LKEVLAKAPNSEKESFFLYLHLIQPHRPYRPHPPYDKLFGPGFDKFEIRQKKGMINMYDAEIREADDLIGKILNHPKISRLLKKSYVLISGDHGEGFGEHGHLDHGNSLYNELLRIPLIIAPPQRETNRSFKVPSQVSNIDLFPTILSLAGIQSPPSAEGKNLFRYLTQKPSSGESELFFSEGQHSGNIEALACFRGNMKYIYEPKQHSPVLRLYNLGLDPGEWKNLVREGIKFSQLHDSLLQHKADNERRRSRFHQKTNQPDPETVERLRALGYVTN
jgi:choline-sulfatase